MCEFVGVIGKSNLYIRMICIIDALTISFIRLKYVSLVTDVKIYLPHDRRHTCVFCLAVNPTRVRLPVILLSLFFCLYAATS